MDVFGRDKHSDYRDDMGGVGSFTRQNRTLYIGRITETRNTAEVVEKHFEEFGEIERSKLDPLKAMRVGTWLTGELLVGGLQSRSFSRAEWRS